MKFRTLSLLGALLCCNSSYAFEVSSLPYEGTPDWVDIVFSGTSMTSSGSETTMVTAQSRGVWFGAGSGYSNSANWNLSSAAEGNYVTLTAKFSTGAADWSAYIYDGTHAAAFQFAPTGCSNDCYSVPPRSGYEVYHAANGTGQTTTFFDLALTQYHTFELLLKNGQVYYRVDGVVVHSGAAAPAPLSNPLLVIGDGSGSTLTGTGSMIVSAVGVDASPSMNALVTTAPIPEPQTYALMLVGLGLMGWIGRRRRISVC